MSTHRSRVGACPLCGEELGRHDVLITYEADRRRRHWAECPACEEVVHPEP